MQRNRILIRLALFVLVASCAAGGSKQAAAPPTMSQPAPETAGSPEAMTGNPHKEIDELEAKIEATSAQLDLRDVPAAPTNPQWVPMATGTRQSDAKCRPAKTDRCTSSCTMSDSICDNAKRICDIAKGLPGDGYATKKCDKASATCEASYGRCCGCNG